MNFDPDDSVLLPWPAAESHHESQMFIGVESSLKDIFYHTMTEFQSPHSTKISQVAFGSDQPARPGGSAQQRLLYQSLAYPEEYRCEGIGNVQQRIEELDSLLDDCHTLQHAEYNKVFEFAEGKMASSILPVQDRKPTATLPPQQQRDQILPVKPCRPSETLAPQQQRDGSASLDRKEAEISGISVYSRDGPRRRTNTPVSQHQNQWAEMSRNGETEWSGVTLYVPQGSRRPTQALTPNQKQQAESSRIGLPFFLCPKK